MEIDTGLILALVIAVITVIVEHVGRGKYKKYLTGAIEINRLLYSATEEAKAKGVKKLVAASIRQMSAPAQEIDNLMVSIVDSDKAASAPPIVRFWRRFLAGKNLPGVVGRIALNQAITKHIEAK